MPCHPLVEKDENGNPIRVVGFVCTRIGRFEKQKTCYYCKREVKKQCDFKLRTGRTCNRDLCDSCVVSQEKAQGGLFQTDTIDHCRIHTIWQAPDILSGRTFDAKYQSICYNPNCRRRVEIGEKIKWYGTGKVLCSECVSDIAFDNERQKDIKQGYDV